MPIAIVRVILYVKNIPTVAQFYQRHFGEGPGSEFDSDLESRDDLAARPGHAVPIA
jgi:hypothetical protein